MGSTPSLRGFPIVVFKLGPVLVRLMMAFPVRNFCLHTFRCNFVSLYSGVSNVVLTSSSISTFVSVSGYQ